MNTNKGKDTFFSRNRSLNCRGKLLSLDSPKIMGILNITPDSFYDGGVYENTKDALGHVERMLNEGAEIIDIGASSSRPGAATLDPQVEFDRLHPVLSEIRVKYPDIIISLDTIHSKVAEEMIKSYAIDMINDISAGNYDENMVPVISKLQVPYLCMHMQGDPFTMQNNPLYQNITDEVIRFFSERVNLLHRKGISDILIDPGFGFGKTMDHNYELLQHFHSFQLFELPVVAGISRKSMIYNLLETNSDNSLNGTTAAHMILLQNGVNILRVHDVKPAKEAINIFMETNKYRN